MSDFFDEWNRKQRDARAQADLDDVRLNPHQFGDQLTLFDAPLGQPDRGTFRGNQHARLYRSVQVPTHAMEALRKSQWGDDVGGPDHEAVLEVLAQAARPHSDRGHDTNLGIHWQHSKAAAEDYASDLTTSGRHGDRGISVIIEADHPGYDHVVDNTPNPGGGPPEGARDGARSNNRLTGYAKDWALINDTVGPHNLDSAMLPEVPVRPGAPMAVHAIHMPDPAKSGNYLRNPVQFKGQA